MPPVTPSPHRFLPGRRRQASPTKASSSAASPPLLAPEKGAATPQQRRAPVLRNATPQTTKSGSVRDQFAQTPRFAFGRLPQNQTDSGSASPPKPSLAQALRRSIRPAEDVEETLAVDPHDEEDIVGLERAEAWPTTESTQQQQIADEPGWREDLAFSPKRRKLDGLPEHALPTMDAPARPLFKHPTTPASHYASAPHHFVRAGSVASSIASNDTIASRRPPFLRASVAPQDQSEPLPEVFSPHRRGEKFVPGGMAATLQQWVIETGQVAIQSRRGQGYLGGEDYVLRIDVGSSTGSNPILVKSQSWDGEEVRILLINAKRSVVDVLAGSVIGIRAPTWEVELDQHLWTVGVDWKVLS